MPNHPHGGPDETGACAALTLPRTLTDTQRRLLTDVATRYDDQYGVGLLGMVLSGSAGRGVATERSDLDVYLVLGDGTEASDTARSALIDEIPIGIGEVEIVAPFGSEGWWQRWSFAWAPVLLDRSGGRLVPALHRQATLTQAEQADVLLDHDRLDGWLNLAYRALKSHRDGRLLEARLDAAESVPWLLDTVFALHGRVRPYNKYLPWELRNHPLDSWAAEDTLALLQSMLDGDPDAIRTAFAQVEEMCGRFDSERGDTALTDVIHGWGDDLKLFTA